MRIRDVQYIWDAMGAKARCRVQGLPTMVLVGLFGVSEEGHMTAKAALECSVEEGVQGACLNHRHYNLRLPTCQGMSETATGSKWLTVSDRLWS